MEKTCFYNVPVLFWACLSHEIIQKSRTQAQTQKFHLIYKKLKIPSLQLFHFHWAATCHRFIAKWKHSVTLVLTLSKRQKVIMKEEGWFDKLHTSTLLTYTFGCVWLVLLPLCPHLFRCHLKWSIRLVCGLFCRKANTVWNLNKPIVKGIDIQNEIKTYKYFQWRRKKDYQKRLKRPNYIQQL